jgi:hypothetical protein
MPEIALRHKNPSDKSLAIMLALSNQINEPLKEILKSSNTNAPKRFLYLFGAFLKPVLLQTKKYLSRNTIGRWA